MIKRFAVLAASLLAVAVPAALADTGTPAPAQARPHLQQRLQNVRRHVLTAETAFRRHCVVQVADAARCADAARRMLARLQKADGRVGDLIARVQQRGGHDDVVAALQDVQQRIQQLEQELQRWLASSPAAGTSSGGSSSASVGADGLEPLDQLGADLAAARTAAQQSGLPE